MRRTHLGPALLVAFSALVWHRASTAQAPARLEVELLSFRNDQGTAACSLYASKDGFPGDAKKALQVKWVRLSGGKATCVFENVAPGTYAVAVFHDENDNHEMDTNLLGIPKEGVGVSNDAKGFMGPPPYDKAKFNYPGGQLHISLHMKYL